MKKFEFFPRLHALFASKANVNPPAVTTGVGPRGRQTFYYQKLDDTAGNSTVPATSEPGPLQTSNRAPTQSPEPVGVTNGWADSFGVSPEEQVTIQSQYATLQDLLTAAQAFQPIQQPVPVSSFKDLVYRF